MGSGRDDGDGKFIRVPVQSGSVTSLLCTIDLLLACCLAGFFSHPSWKYNQKSFPHLPGGGNLPCCYHASCDLFVNSPVCAATFLAGFSENVGRLNTKTKLPRRSSTKKPPKVAARPLLRANSLRCLCDFCFLDREDEDGSYVDMI